MRATCRILQCPQDQGLVKVLLSPVQDYGEPDSQGAINPLDQPVALGARPPRDRARARTRLGGLYLHAGLGVPWDPPVRAG